VREKAAASKEALAALREVQKENGPVLKAVSKAEAEVEEVEEDVAKVRGITHSGVWIRSRSEGEP
jgi:hypothetical protein